MNSQQHKKHITLLACAHSVSNHTSIRLAVQTMVEWRILQKRIFAAKQVGCFNYRVVNLVED